jgi:hypothetical protein
MATLTRPKTAPSPAVASSVSAGVPAPFPLDELRQIQLAGSSSTQSHLPHPPGDTVQGVLVPSDQAEPAQQGSTGLLVSSQLRCCIRSLLINIIE